MAITHLSASSMDLYNECPLAFMGKYVYGWPMVAPAMQAQAMEVGKAVHTSIEAHHQGRDAITALCQSWGTITIPMPPGLFEKALGMVRCYTADEQLDPRDVCEEKFSISVPGVSVPVIGYIDRHRGLTVHEYKSTSSPTWWSQDRVDESKQISLYCMAVGKKNHGAQIEATCHVLKHHGGEFTHEKYVTTRNKADLQECEEYVRSTWSAINTGELRAACRPGKCRFPTRCREYGYVGTDSLELVLT